MKTANVKAPGLVILTLLAGISMMMQAMSPTTIGGTASSSLASKKGKVKYYEKRYGT